MGSNLIRYLCVSTLVFSALTQEDTKTAAQTQDRDVQVIQMTAKRYEFSPSRVRVKSGMKVQLKIAALDRDHGFKSAVIPNGAGGSAVIGLKFTSPQGNDGWKLKKGKETTIEFVAKTAGTYDFQCAVACGIHHARMKGQIIVDQ
jgi:heme/copper-type cytochrome/quinol oxidase subunit 2